VIPLSSPTQVYGAQQLDVERQSDPDPPQLPFVQLPVPPPLFGHDGAIEQHWSFELQGLPPQNAPPSMPPASGPQPLVHPLVHSAPLSAQ
jgi:hypothetical protein